MTKRVRVELGAKTYDVVIGQTLLKHCGEFLAPILNRPKVAIITEETVGKIYLETLRNGLSQYNIACDVLSLPAGETTKSWPFLNKSVEWMLGQKIERQDVVIALGGGVIGDLVGFASAIMRRGIRFVQIPTSLLAQVDSSVGGKTGINVSAGKNLVGAFHQPSLVLADISVLDTLPRRDFLAGYGEVVKYGLLGNVSFFEWLEINGVALAQGNKKKMVEAICVCCQMKADIVARDENEYGDRALLNLGHTFGHAFEASTGYSNRLLHGEGVAIGCVLAFELSARIGLCSQELPSRVRAHFKSMGMTTDLLDIPGPLPSAEEILDLMGQDKKVVDGQLRFILVRDIGEAFVSSNVHRNDILAVLSEALFKRG